MSTNLKSNKSQLNNSLKSKFSFGPQPGPRYHQELISATLGWGTPWADRQYGSALTQLAFISTSMGNLTNEMSLETRGAISERIVGDFCFSFVFVKKVSSCLFKI